MFLTEFWYIAALRHEIDATPKRRLILGKPVVLYRAPDGAAVALEDRCIHREVPLSMGSVCADGTLQCLYHGLRFDPAGACVHIPEQTLIPAGARVRAYTLIERGEWAWIWLGDTPPDQAAIPPYPWFERPGWRARTGRLHVRANYRLVVDNLLNMAHLPFVHPRTIGSEGVVRDAKVTTRREGNKVRLSRRMYDIEPPPTYRQAGGFEGHVNRWQDIEFSAPGFFEFSTGVIDAAHPIPEDGEAALATNARILARHTMHGVVPETERSVNYYVGFSYDPERMDESTADFVYESVFNTFMEDVAVLEAQQDNMELVPDAPRIDIVSDVAGLHAMRVIADLERHQGAI